MKTVMDAVNEFKGDEVVTLFDGQTTVLFASVNPIYIAIKGARADLIEGADFKRSKTNYSEITLTYSYPSGTILTGRNYR